MTKSGVRPNGSSVTVLNQKRFRLDGDAAHDIHETSLDGSHTLPSTGSLTPSTAGTADSGLAELLRETIKTSLADLVSLDREFESMHGGSADLARVVECQMQLKDIGNRIIRSSSKSIRNDVPLDGALPVAGEGYYHKRAEVSNFHSTMIEPCYEKYARTKQELRRAKEGSDDNRIAILAEQLENLGHLHHRLHIACMKELAEVDREYGLEFE